MGQNYKELIIHFYSAFQTLNYGEMQKAYHPDAQFTDPVFGTLNCAEVRAMWEMLLTRGKDLKIAFSDVHATEDPWELPVGSLVRIFQDRPPCSQYYSVFFRI